MGVCMIISSATMVGAVFVLLMIDNRMMINFFFFFQAEDGIRDVAVTGVQTCALPIYGKMNIGIVETGHFEVAYPLIRLFDTAQNNLTIFTSDHCFRQLSFSLSPATHKHDWVVKSNAPNAVFIYRMYKEIRKRNIQLLFLSTVSDNFIFYAMLIRRFPNMRVILTLHDINTHFQF